MIENGEIKSDLLDGWKTQAPHVPLVISTTAITILSLALPIMTLQIYDRVLPNPGSGTLPVLIAGVCLAVLLEIILRLIRSYVLEWSGAAYEHKMSCTAMDHILNADLSRLGMAGIGENLNRMIAINRLKDFYNGHSFLAKFELVFVPVYICVTAYVAGPLVVVPVAVLMVFTLVSLSMGQDLCRRLYAREKHDDGRYNFLISTLENIHAVKSFAAEKTLARKYENLETPSAIANFDVTQSTSKSFNATTVFSHLMVTLVVIAGAIFVLKGQITTGALISTILLSGRMMQPVQKAVVLWARYQDFKIAQERLQNIFTSPVRHKGVSDPKRSPSGHLEIDNLSFRFGDDASLILKDINLDIHAGETVLLSGGHGQGKTVLLNLIAGLYPPSAGGVLIDGMNVQSYAARIKPGYVSYISTEGAMFIGTIRENMTCFGLIPEYKVYEIARLLNVDRDVAGLSRGFDTPLSSSGADGVPPGLKQRISIVRALALRPKIILFDNADRGLDVEGYNALYNLLGRLKGQATMILVSDDFNICDLADRFLTLSDGNVVEDIPEVVPGQVKPYREITI